MPPRCCASATAPILRVHAAIAAIAYADAAPIARLLPLFRHAAIRRRHYALIFFFFFLSSSAQQNGRRVRYECHR